MRNCVLKTFLRLSKTGVSFCIDFGTQFFSSEHVRRLIASIFFTSITGLNFSSLFKWTSVWDRYISKWNWVLNWIWKIIYKDFKSRKKIYPNMLTAGNLNSSWKCTGCARANDRIKKAQFFTTYSLLSVNIKEAYKLKETAFQSLYWFLRTSQS